MPASSLVSLIPQGQTHCWNWLLPVPRPTPPPLPRLLNSPPGDHSRLQGRPLAYTEDPPPRSLAGTSPLARPRALPSRCLAPIWPSPGSTSLGSRTPSPCYSGQILRVTLGSFLPSALPSPSGAGPTSSGSRGNRLCPQRRPSPGHLHLLPASHGPQGPNPACAACCSLRLTPH